MRAIAISIPSEFLRDYRWNAKRPSHKAGFSVRILARDFVQIKLSSAFPISYSGQLSRKTHQRGKIEPVFSALAKSLGQQKDDLDRLNIRVLPGLLLIQGNHGGQPDERQLTDHS